MKRRFYKHPLALCVALIGASASADDELAPITISGTAGSFTSLEEMASVTRIDGQAAREAVGAGGASPSMVVRNTPSVNFQSADPYGLSEVGFHETLKIRGVGQSGPASSRNINDLPVTGNPGGSKGIIDMENVAEVSIYRGAAPVDKALGFSNLPGKINLRVLAPLDELRTDYSLAAGTDAFSRVFVRQDTGKHGIASGFVSGSYSAGDKWKGEGDFERQNITGGLKLDGGQDWKAEVYAGYNEDARHNYRFFDYATVSNFANFNQDWGTNPAKPDYYDYNRQDFTDRFLFGSVTGRVAQDMKLSFKPYVLKETGEYWFSSLNKDDPSKSRVIEWMIDHENIGAVTELDWNVGADTQVKAGLWLHNQQPPGPPVTQRKYLATAQGLKFDGWSVLADNERHRIISPYASWFKSFERVDVEAGLRYVDLRLGALTAYNNTGKAAGLADPDAARAAGGVNSMASAEAKTLDAWLPFVGMNWRLDRQTSLLAHAGRTYGLDVNLFPYYYAQQAAFKAKGVSFQSLWDQLELETADNFDVGLRHVREGWYAGATLFYALHQNKQSTIYDPVVDARYPWNVADASRYGIELEAGMQLTEAWSVSGNYSWNRFRYDQDLALSSKVNLATDGKQVVDTPEHLVNLGTRYRMEAWTLGADVRYVGERYGDVLNLEKVDAVTLVDAMLQYRLNRAVNVTLDVRNLFDTEYVGPISAADDAIANFTAALNGVTGNGSQYQYGAPRSVFVSVSGQF